MQAEECGRLIDDLPSRFVGEKVQWMGLSLFAHELAPLQVYCPPISMQPHDPVVRTRRAEPALRPRYALFVVSGFTGLVREITWMRSFGLIFGCATRAAMLFRGFLGADRRAGWRGVWAAHPSQVESHIDDRTVSCHDRALPTVPARPSSGSALRLVSSRWTRNCLSYGSGDRVEVRPAEISHAVRSREPVQRDCTVGPWRTTSA